MPTKYEGQLLDSEGYPIEYKAPYVVGFKVPEKKDDKSK